MAHTTRIVVAVDLRALTKTLSPRLLLGMARAAIGGLTGGGGEVSAPASVQFSREFEHRFAARATTSAGPAAAMRAVLDFAAYDQWFAMHTGWPKGVPAAPALGDAFTEDVVIMGTPARLAWTVTHLDPPRGFAIEGRGPMGSHAALWISVEPAAGGAAITASGGLHADALKGPMGAMVARTMRVATAASLDRLAAMLDGPQSAGGPHPDAPHPGALHPGAHAPARVRTAASPKPAPVPFGDTVVDAWTPVLIGVGQVRNRPAEDGPADPMTLAADAVRAALTDSGGAGLLERRVAVAAVPSTSWSYGTEQAGILADDLLAGLPAADFLTQSAPLGGDGPQRLVSDAAQAISEGLADVAVIAGAESFASIAHASRNAIPLAWDRTGRDCDRVIGSDRPGNNAAEDAVGLLAPIYMYALMENALRGRLRRPAAEHTAAISRLWSRFSAVAADNPHAWLPRFHSPAEVDADSPANRPISSPYRKLMTANIAVDLGAGLVLASAAAAARAGVPENKWVFVHAGAHAEEQWFVSERADISQVPAIGAAGRDALAQAQIGIDDVAHVDLYSCFPFAVEAAAEQLGLPLDDPARPLTKTGGLTFAGAPVNNYSTHGIAALAQALRADPGSFGLATALGWFATKHAIGVYSTTPPAAPFAQSDAGLAMARPPARKAVEGFVGEAVVEAATVAYAKSGAPEALIVSALTADGDRVLGRTADPDLVRRALAEDILGAPMRFAADGALAF